MAKQGSVFSQIIRIDGRNSFVEVMDGAFEIGKVLINFVQYDGNTKKQTGMVTYYLDFEDFMVLKQDVISGRIQALHKKNHTPGRVNFSKAIYKQQGGTSARNLTSKGKARPDGKSEARQLLIYAGDKIPFVLQGEKGAGEEQGKGIIVPRYGSKPDVRVAIPMQAEDLKKIVLMVDAKIHAYLAAQYVYLYKEQFQRQAKAELDKRSSYSA